MPASCRAGPVRHVTPRGGDRGGGAAPGKVRRARVEPVRPAHQRARAVRRVELVPREGDVVGPGRGEVDGTVGGELGGVEHDTGPVAVGEVGEPAHQPHLAGDVRGAGEDDERSGGAGQLLLEQTRGLVLGTGDRVPAGAGRPPGQEGGVVVAVEDDDPPTARDAAGEQAERALDPDQRGGGGRMVEVGVLDASTVRGRRREPRRDDRRRRRPLPGGEADRGCGGGAAGGCGEAGHVRGRVPGHASPSGSGTPSSVAVRACRPPAVRGRPGHHPEHPAAEEGCRPASRGLALALVTWSETPDRTRVAGEVRPVIRTGRRSGRARRREGAAYPSERQRTGANQREPVRTGRGACDA